jgi:hypothetical protein
MTDFVADIFRNPSVHDGAARPPVWHSRVSSSGCVATGKRSQEVVRVPVNIQAAILNARSIKRICPRRQPSAASGSAPCGYVHRLVSGDRVGRAISRSEPLAGGYPLRNDGPPRGVVHVMYGGPPTFTTPRQRSALFQFVDGGRVRGVPFHADDTRLDASGLPDRKPEKALCGYGIDNGKATTRSCCRPNPWLDIDRSTTRQHECTFRPHATNDSAFASQTGSTRSTREDAGVPSGLWYSDPP